MAKRTKGTADVEAFVNREMFAAPTAGQVSRFELRQVKELGNERVAWIDANKERDVKLPGSIAGEIMDAAQVQADYAGGMCAFELRCFRGDDRQFCAQMRFRLEGFATDIEELPARQEQVSSAALAREATKYAGDASRLLISGMETIVAGMKEELENTRAELRQSREYEFKLRGMVSDLEDKRQERELKGAREMMKLQAGGDVLKLVTGMLPGLAQRATGLAGLLPRGVTSEQSMLRAWLESLTADERKRMVEGLGGLMEQINLPTEKMLAFAAILAAAMEGPAQPETPPDPDATNTATNGVKPKARA